MSLSPLQERILDAHRSGDQRTLEKLQAEYRRTGTFTAADRGAVCEPVRVVEPAAAKPRTARRPSVSGKVEVLFTARALEAIRHQAYWGTGTDGKETGGFLFGVNAGDQVMVTRAGGPGEQATRKADSLSMSEDALTRWELDDMTSRIGCWHSHPGTREGKPSGSSGDLLAWRSALKRINAERWQPFYLGLILTGERGWTRPTIHAWVLDHAGSLERATVKA